MIRRLTEHDIPACLDLSSQAGWNQTWQDWRRLVRIQPDGCFGIETDGRLVATTTVVCYERDLAWIGMVLTHRDYQRRGYARELLKCALEYTDFRGVRSVKLDATDAGKPLYATLGFVDEHPVERWRRERQALGASTAAEEGPVELALDRRAFGADRSRLLLALAQEQPAHALGPGYVLQRPGRIARYLGPCVAQTAAVARALISAALAVEPLEPWFWDLLPTNAAAMEIAQDLGFTPARKLVRMFRGERTRGDDTLVFGCAGFEVG